MMETPEICERCEHVDNCPHNYRPVDGCFWPEDEE